MIKVLKNPITQTYIDFKELISRDNFLWGHAKENYAEGSHPAYFTHPHRGNPVYKKEKYIITGWVTMG